MTAEEEAINLARRLGPRTIVHRNFAGEHEMSEGCWCRPIVVEAADERNAEEVVEEVEKLDG